MSEKIEIRKARCSYYGRAVKDAVLGMRSGCERCKQNVRSGTTKLCKCEVDSSPELSFFRERPDKPFDEYFCGCLGWD